MNPASYAADIAEAQGELRGFSNTRMTSTCNVRRRTGRMVQNESTGREVAEWATVYASIPCQVAGATSARASATRASSAGGVEYQQASRFLHLPWDTSDLKDNDFVEVTAGDNAGAVLRIVEAATPDQVNSLRLPVLSEARPQEWT